MDIVNIYSIKKQIEQVFIENQYEIETCYQEDLQKYKNLDKICNEMDNFNQSLFLNWVKSINKEETNEFYKSGLILTMVQIVMTFKLDIKQYGKLGMDRLATLIDEYDIEKYTIFEKIVRDIPFILESDMETLKDAFFTTYKHYKGDISTPLAAYNAYLEGKKL